MLVPLNTVQWIYQIRSLKSRRFVYVIIITGVSLEYF